MKAIHAWGRLCSPDHRLVYLHNRDRVVEQISDSLPGLAHGMGRSYGDVCLNPGGTLWDTTGLNRFISFDDNTGYLTCEAGVLLQTISQLFLPRGWMLPVTPGTQFVTVGGAIANDVHGKNHHRFSSFGAHVKSLQLVRTDGRVLLCDDTQHRDWLHATIGGLGLTGVITQACIALRRVPGPWLRTHTQAFAHVDQFFDLAQQATSHAEYTVAWIDAMHKNGRGIFHSSNHIEHHALEKKRRHFSIPFTLPISFVNRRTQQLISTTHYHLHVHRQGERIEHFEKIFYPLDHIEHWNRLYGRRGFFQFQCALPMSHARAGVSALLHQVAQSKDTSFLTVLKTFGDCPPPGMLSFARNGITLAIDFCYHGDRTEKLMEQLEIAVREHHGWIYPAKDACMSRQTFLQSYPRLTEFMSYRDPGISSGLSRRLLGN